MPGVTNRFVVCDMYNRFRFIADDMVWREQPIHSEFFIGAIKRFGKKDICSGCLAQIKKRVQGIKETMPIRG